jgi:phosphohistidine phosphatase
MRQRQWSARVRDLAILAGYVHRAVRPTAADKMGQAGRLVAGSSDKDERPTGLRQLLLLRHAKSSWDDSRLSDHSRPLNQSGRAAAGAMRQAMLGLALAPDVVLVSSSRRTLQTLEALEPWEDTPLIEPMDALYLATAPQILQILNKVAETARSVLLIGHNPGLQELALQLSGGARDPADARRLAEGYPTSALAEFTVMGTWRGLAPGSARLHRFLAPRDLPHLAV